MSSRWRSVFHDVYGSYPLHLLTMAAGFALLGCVLVTVKLRTLWNPHSWWQSIAVWFAAAVIAHDLVLFAIYALADRMLWIRARRRPGRPLRGTGAQLPSDTRSRVGLTLLVFLPGIIEQGGSTYLAATGPTQQPFLDRWLLLTAAMFTTSAVVYLTRLVVARRSTADVND